MVDKGEIFLLGKETVKKLGILKLGLNINNVDKVAGFPKVKDVIVKLTINPHAKPVQQPLKRVPISVEKQVEEKLKAALQSNIIERVMELSAWVSPIVVICKTNDDIRICVDMQKANEDIL